MLDNANFNLRQSFTTETPRDSRILIADDNQYVEPLQVALTFAGYDAITSSHDEESLREVRENSPSLVLLGTQMPKVNGYVVCAYLKVNQGTRPIRVISATSQPTAQGIVVGVEAGCNDFLPKPVAKEVLVPTVRTLFRTRQPTDSMGDIEDVLTTPGRASELKEGYPKSHVDRVAVYAFLLVPTGVIKRNGV